MDNYVKQEVTTLNQLYKEGQNGDQHKFQDELQKIAQEHPDKLRAIAQEMKRRDAADPNLPAIDIFIPKEGKDKGKVAQIDLDSKDAHGLRTGQQAETFQISGKYVFENKNLAGRRQEQEKDEYFPRQQLEQEQKKHQLEANNRADKGELSWVSINGKSFPLSPDGGGRPPAQENGNPADNGFKADWENNGRQLAQSRYNHWLQKNEQWYESAQDTLEKIEQHKKI